MPAGDEPLVPRPESQLSPHLAHWADQLERSRWPGWLVDENLVLRFASTELKVFIGRSVGHDVDDDDVGVGLPLLHAQTNEAWSATVAPESMISLMPRAMAYVKGEFDFTDERARALIPEPLWPFYEMAERKSGFGVLSDRFMYTQPGLPDIPVEFVVFGIRDTEGRFMGAVSVSQIGLRPTLVNLLARGDERMYERMANLQEPRRCQGAILFADLEGSTRLSRALSTSTYFRLIRSLATAMDNTIASNGGVVGKHAGDGVSGFFLVSEGTEPTRIAEEALRAAREIRSATREAIEALSKDTNIDPDDFGMNVGLHWGGSLFVGQLVPGGRLDITALGDSVNECARIQEAATRGRVLASKHFLEHLSDSAVADAGLDRDALVYRSLAELDGVSEKVARDAGSIPVASVD